MSETTRRRYILPPADADSSPSWRVPYAAEPTEVGGLLIRNHHEDWAVEPEGLPSLLRACLEAYTDPETGMSGREVLEELLDRGDYDARRRLQAKEAAGRMLADPDPTA